MPFSKITCGISGRLHGFTDCKNFFRKILRAVSGYGDFLIRSPMASDEIDHTYAGRILSRLNAGPGGGTDRTSCVGIGEQHSFAGEFVNIWRFIETVSVSRQVGPSQIIGQNENYIGLFRNGGCLDSVYTKNTY